MDEAASSDGDTGYVIPQTEPARSLRVDSRQDLIPLSLQGKSRAPQQHFLSFSRPVKTDTNASMAVALPIARAVQWLPYEKPARCLQVDGDVTVCLPLGNGRDPVIHAMGSH